MPDKAVCEKPAAGKESKTGAVTFRTVELDMWSAPGWEAVRQGAEKAKCGAAASSGSKTKNK